MCRMPTESGSSRRAHTRRCGSVRPASSGPTISSQWVMMSTAAKPCFWNAPVSVRLTRSASGRGRDLRGGEEAKGIAPQGRARQARTMDARTEAKPLPAGEGAARARCPDPPALRAWYDRHRRDLPWRARRGEKADPYRVWLSEIMLQQTRVETVGPYYEKFIARFSTVRALGKVRLGEVLKLWAGLGYYARARNLHACARAVSREHRGRFPDTEEGLRELPGIGAYTAAAVAAIAFGRKATPLDGNIERVVARLFAVEAPLPPAKAERRRLAQEFTPVLRAGDFAQAMMDLGAIICTPRRPSCLLCPFSGDCAAFTRGDQETFPRRAPKAEGKLRRGAAFVCSAPTARCCCAPGPRAAFSAACAKCRALSGAPISTCRPRYGPRPTSPRNGA